MNHPSPYTYYIKNQWNNKETLMKSMNISNWHITSRFLCCNAEKTNYATSHTQAITITRKKYDTD